MSRHIITFLVITALLTPCAANADAGKSKSTKAKTSLNTATTRPATIKMKVKSGDPLPYNFITPQLDGWLFFDVPFISYGTTPPIDPTVNRPFFDYYSWQTFIALMWPSDPNPVNRGIPMNPGDPNTFQRAYRSIPGQPINTAGVFMAYRDVTQLFPPEGTPVTWNEVGNAYSVCSNVPPLPNLPVYLNDSVPSDTLQAGYFVPVIDQKGNYTRYETKFNQQEYTQTLSNGWYQKPLPPTITLPAGSMEIKMSWRPLTASDDPARYYAVNMYVLDPNTPPGKKGNCTVQLMGMVGMHIMVVTPTFPQWVWATFEQVDNVSAVNGSYFTPPANQFTQDHGYSYMPAPVPPISSNPIPVNLQRLVPVPTTPLGTTPNLPYGISTAGMNQTYQRLLAGTVFQYYQLIMTQWPSQPKQTAKLGVPFPDDGVANTTIESFGGRLQDPTCMGCHSAAINQDFSWTLKARPRPAPQK